MKSNKKLCSKRTLSRDKAMIQAYLKLLVSHLALLINLFLKELRGQDHLHKSKSQQLNQLLNNRKGKKRRKLRLRLLKICKKSARTTVTPLRSTTGLRRSKRSQSRSQFLRELLPKWWTSKSSQNICLLRSRAKTNRSWTVSSKRKWRSKTLSGASRIRNSLTSHLRKLMRLSGRPSLLVTKKLTQRLLTTQRR